MGNFTEAVDNLDLVDGMYAWREPAMDAENLVVDHHRQCQEVEHICKVMPNVGGAIFAATFGVEAVGLCNATRLMVTADEVETLRITELEAYEKRYCFDTE